jgi:hypothetical protein
MAKKSKFYKLNESTGSALQELSDRAMPLYTVYPAGYEHLL